MNKKITLAFISLSFICTPLPLIAHANPSISTQTKAALTLPKESRIPGGIALISLNHLPPDTEAYLGEHRVWVVNQGADRIAIVGIPLDAAESVNLKLINGNGHELDQVTIALQPKTYKEQRLTIKNTAQVNPDPEQLKRFSREAAEQQAVYKTFAVKAGLWPIWTRPAQGRVSSPFGLQRFFNNEPRAPHSGIDIAAPTGHPALAPTDGVVAQTGDYFFNGKTVLIDHGNGLISMLCHLSLISVKPGDVLKAGDLIGKVGSTGRSTGPHLHWTISLNNARIDPTLVMNF